MAVVKYSLAWSMAYGCDVFGGILGVEKALYLITSVHCTDFEGISGCLVVLICLAYAEFSISSTHV